MPRPRLLCAAALACVLGVAGGPARAEESAAELAAQARAACEAGRRAQAREEREERFREGRTLAERAVAADEHNPEAHFALFCNMGELMRIDGESVSSVLQLNRLMAELDRALELKPDYTEALAAKGQLLMRLPRLLGGDAIKGEALLREVIARDPNAFSSRLMVAKACDARGERQEAVTLATRALQIARAQGRADKIAEAQATLAELDAAQ